MAEFEVYINDQVLREVVNDAPGTKEALDSLCSDIEGRANSIASGYRSGVWHEYGSKNAANPGNGKWRDTGRQTVKKGDTPARYAHDVAKRGGVQVGIVYTANYAAQKENRQHNTLLKAI